MKSFLSRVTYRKKHNHLKWYTNEEVTMIQKQLPSLQDKTVFSISVETDMRIGEILGLKLHHFNPFEMYLEVVRQQNIENRAWAKTTERVLPIYQPLVNLKPSKENVYYFDPFKVTNIREDKNGISVIDVLVSVHRVINSKPYESIRRKG